MLTILVCPFPQTPHTYLIQVLVCVFQVPVDSPNSVTGWTPLHHTAFKDHLHVARFVMACPTLSFHTG